MLIPGFAAVVLGTSGFAYMASNDVPTSYAGQGDGAISGYHVTNVHYTLKDQGINGTDMFIQAVSFTLDAPTSAANLYALISNSTSPARYGECTNTGGNSFTCSHSGNMVRLTAAQNLTVVAAS